MTVSGVAGAGVSEASLAGCRGVTLAALPDRSWRSRNSNEGAKHGIAEIARFPD
jgi:hypothetical protein